jgi:hypothetical protein
MPERQDDPQTSPTSAHKAPSTLAFLNVALLAIAAYNTLELLIWVFHFFKRRRALYFWSILTCNLSVAFSTLIVFLQYFDLAPFTFTGVAMAMALPVVLVAQLLILYSRLHLISTPYGLLRFIFWGIIVTSVFLHTPPTINLIGFAAGNMHFAAAEAYMEWYMLAGSVLREVFICGLYLYQAVRQLRPIIEVKGAAGRRVMMHLIIVSVAVILLNLFTVLVISKGPAEMGAAFICMSQSVKLRVEFVVLTELLELLGAPMSLRGSMWEGADGLESGQGSRIVMLHERERGERRYAQAHQGDWLTVPGRTWGGDNSRGTV